MRQLKNTREQAFLSFDKHTKNIPLCCHIFFEYVNSALRAKIPEYQEAEIHDHKEGILKCPECIIKELKN
jgi:hypothetical protein